MNSDTQNASDFALLLRRLLDETDIFSRSQWAEFLNVSEAAISQWVTDKTVPRAELLRMIVELIRSVDDAPHEPLREFEKMAAKPSGIVSPNGKRFGESVNAYLVSPLLDGFLLDLKGLQPEKQGRVLLKASRLCAEEAGLKVPPTAPVYEPHRSLAATARKSAVLRTHLEWAEATLARIEEDDPGFLAKVMNYLTSVPDNSLLYEVRKFCLNAFAYIRTHNDTRPRMIIASIIKSKMIDPSLFDRLWAKDALNAVFVADEEGTIIIEDGTNRVWCRSDVGLEQNVAMLRRLSVHYIPSNTDPLSGKQGELEGVA